MAPELTSCDALLKEAPRKVSGPQVSCSLFLAARFSSSAPSARSSASGFSLYTCFPCSSARRLTLAWAAGTVRLMITSMPSRRRSSSGDMPGMPCGAPALTARCTSRSASPCTCTPLLCSSVLRYSGRMLPQPIMPRPTGSSGMPVPFLRAQVAHAVCHGHQHVAVVLVEFDDPGGPRGCVKDGRHIHVAVAQCQHRLVLYCRSVLEVYQRYALSQFGQQSHRIPPG